MADVPAQHTHHGTGQSGPSCRSAGPLSSGSTVPDDSQAQLVVSESSILPSPCLVGRTPAAVPVSGRGLAEDRTSDKPDGPDPPGNIFVMGRRVPRETRRAADWSSSDTEREIDAEPTTYQSSLPSHGDRSRKLWSSTIICSHDGPASWQLWPALRY